jgi:hypothetical protein
LSAVFARCSGEVPNQKHPKLRSALLLCLVGPRLYGFHCHSRSVIPLGPELEVSKRK